MAVWDWSKIDLDNKEADPSINWAEFQNPDTVNNSARSMMARVAEALEDMGPNRTSTGTAANEYSATSESAPADLTKPFHVFFIAHQGCTGAATLQINALARKPVRAKTGVNLSDGDIQAGTVVGAYWNPGSDEYLITNSGFHVNALGPSIGAAHQATLKVGDPVINFDVTPRPGRIRLGQTATPFVEADYPELSQWVANQGYLWGRDTGAGTANLPPAAGYFLRIIGTDTTVDPSGPTRDPGSIQNDLFAEHFHTKGSLGVIIQNATVSVLASGQGTANVEGGSGASVAGKANAALTDIHNHTAIVTGQTGSTGSTETRPKNVGVHLDIVASAQEANADVYGVNGVPYKWDTGTADADPGSGLMRSDSADLSAATEIYISDNGANGEDLSAWIDTFDDAGTAIRGHLHVYQIGAPSQFAIFAVNGPVVSGTNYKTLSVSYVSGSTSLADEAIIGVLFHRVGVKGDSGTDAGLRWEFAASTVMSDPGAGAVRWNDADPSLATKIALSGQVSDTGNPNVSNFLLSWDDSTSSIKGTLVVRSTENDDRFYLYDITGLTDQGTWVEVDVTYRDGGSTAFDVSEVVSFSHNRTGDKGDTGATVVSTSVGTTSTLAAGSPATVANSGTATAAILDFGIPAGPAGADGADGADGVDGVDGVNGTDGADGIFAGTETIETSADDGDIFSFQDVSDSDNPKRITKANLLAGASGGSSHFVPFSKYARLNKTSAQTIPTSTFTTVTWNVEESDTDGFFDAGEPTKLTVPSGITRVALAAYYVFLNGSGGTNGFIEISHFNSSDTSLGTYSDGFNFILDYRSSLWVPPINVSSGDYFILRVYQNSGANRTTDTTYSPYFMIFGIDGS
jgi:hypothetical protein